MTPGVPVLMADDLDWALAPLPASAPADVDDFLTDLIIEAGAYRLLAQVAIEALGTAQTETEAAQRATQALRDELRRYTARQVAP